MELSQQYQGWKNCVNRKKSWLKTDNTTFMKEMQIETFKKKGSYAKEEVPNYKNNYGRTVKFPRMSLKFENVI